MTPAELISEVLDDLEQPHLTDVCMRKLYSCIKSAHKIDRFRRDLLLGYLVDPTISAGVVTFVTDTTIPRTREIRNIRLFKNYTNPIGTTIIPTNEIEIDPAYVDVKETKLLTTTLNYFNFQNLNTYTMAGAQTIIHNVDSLTTCIELQTLAWPTWEYDSVNTTYTTDSWIMEHMPDVVKAYLIYYIGNVVLQDTDIKNAGQAEIIFQRQELLSAYVDDILGTK